MDNTTTKSAETEFVSILGSNEKSEVPSRVSSRSLPDTLPILGLSDIVIFPGAVGKFHHLGQPRNAADLIQIVGGRFGDIGIGLQHGGEQPVAGDEIIHEFEARTGFDEERRDGPGKNDDVRKPENRQRVRQRARRNTAGHLALFI